MNTLVKTPLAYTKKKRVPSNKISTLYFPFLIPKCACMLKAIFVVGFVLLQYCAAGQGISIDLQKHFGGSLADMGQFVHRANDGDLIVIGTARSFDGTVANQHGGSDIWVAKISPLGVIRWQGAWGGSEDDAAVSYAYDATTGQITVVGNINSGNGNITVSRGMGDVWAFRLNATGGLLWQRTLGGSDIDRALKTIHTSDGNVLISAETQSTNGDITGSRGNNDIWLIKLNGSNGTILWRRNYGGSGNDYGDYGGSVLMEPSPGEYLFAANTNSPDGDVGGYAGGGSDAWVVSVNGISGSIFWQRTLGGSGFDIVRQLKVRPNGQYVALVQSSSASFAGYHAGNNGAADNSDVLRCRLTNAGAVVSTKCFGTFKSDIPVDLAILNDSVEVILAAVPGNGGDVTGSIGNEDEFSKDLWLCRVKRDTAIVWQKLLGGTRDDYHAQIMAPGVVMKASLWPMLGSQAVIVLGMSRSSNGNVQRTNPYGPFVDYDIWPLVVDSLGNIIWQTTVGGGRNEWQGGSVAVADSGRFYFTGSTQSFNNNLPGGSTLTDMMLYRINSQNYLAGKVFWDIDSNGVQSGNEPLMGNARIQFIKPGFSQSVWAYGGQYVQVLDTGIYQIACLPPLGYTAPPLRRDTMMGYFEKDTINFPLRRSVPTRDAVVAVVPMRQLYLDSTAEYLLRYGNVGTDTIANGWVIFKKDPRTSLQQTLQPVDSTAGDSLMWRYTQLQPAEWRSIRFTLNTPDTPHVTPLDTLYQTAVITPLVGDTNRLNNYDTLYQVVDTATLVRIKTPNHGYRFDSASVQAGGWLQYTIRYTYTGPGTLDSLLVTDTLDALLDSASYQLIYTSHPVQVSPTVSRNLSWAFNNMGLLPGQTVIISFRVKPRSTVTVGDIINNKAWIWRRPGALLQATEEVLTEIR
jgi:hypothetical protein